MNVVLTLKEVIIITVGSFDLNGRMVELVLVPAKICHFMQSLKGSLRNNVAAEWQFPSCNGPHMEIMKFINAWEVDYIIFELLNIEFIGWPFHQDTNAAFKYWHWSKDNDDREDEGANGIDDGPGWHKIDYHRGDDDTDTHE